MKKILLSLLLLISITKADLLDDKIKNLVGENNYSRHKNLINVLFRDKSNYYMGEKLNLSAILKQLMNNGLITLELNSPQPININFIIKGNGLKTLKLVNNTLRSLGYYYYFTKAFTKTNEDEISWNISLTSKFVINPYTLVNELKKEEIRVFDINRENNSNWVYKIDTNFAKISQSIFVSNNEKVILQKPLKPYMLKTDGAKELEVISRRLNRWYPYIVFYDENLEILGVTKENKAYGTFSTQIPEGTKYIKLSDLFTLNNIKRGLSVTLKE